MEEFSTSGEPDAAVVFANPAFYRKLLFPFIGSVLLQRLNLDNEERCSYMGEKGSRTYCTSLTGNGGFMAVWDKRVQKIAFVGSTRILAGDHEGQNYIYSRLQRANTGSDLIPTSFYDVRVCGG
jgi:hypothetical protein